MFLQRTIRKKVSVEGIGLHSGQPVQLTFRPAPEGSGIHFFRMDLSHHPSVPAQADFVTTTQFATTVGRNGISISTVEHCLSAVAALRLDNLFIEVNGPELPIIDGSARPFYDALQSVGFQQQEIPRKYAFVTEHLFLGDQDKYATLAPYSGLRITCTIEFAHPKIGLQSLDLDINESSYEVELAGARTFGFLKDVESLKAKGLARGGSLENAVVMNTSDIINPEGLRYPDEFVRHKILDALGDLATLGMPLMGHVTLYKSGHDMMNRLVKKVIERPECFRAIEIGSQFPEAEVGLLLQPLDWQRLSKAN